jgi:hypothetical protein
MCFLILNNDKYQSSKERIFPIFQKTDKKSLNYVFSDNGEKHKI